MKIIELKSKLNNFSVENLATIFSPTIFCTGNSPFPSLPNQVDWNAFIAYNFPIFSATRSTSFFDRQQIIDGINYNF